MKKLFRHKKITLLLPLAVFLLLAVMAIVPAKSINNIDQYQAKELFEIPFVIRHFSLAGENLLIPDRLYVVDIKNETLVYDLPKEAFQGKNHFNIELPEGTYVTWAEKSDYDVSASTVFYVTKEGALDIVINDGGKLNEYMTINLESERDEDGILLNNTLRNRDLTPQENSFRFYGVAADIYGPVEGAHIEVWYKKNNQKIFETYTAADGTFLEDVHLDEITAYFPTEGRFKGGTWRGIKVTATKDGYVEELPAGYSFMDFETHPTGAIVNTDWEDIPNFYAQLFLKRNTSPKADLTLKLRDHTISKKEEKKIIERAIERYQNNYHLKKQAQCNTPADDDEVDVEGHGKMDFKEYVQGVLNKEWNVFRWGDQNGQGNIREAYKAGCIAIMSYARSYGNGQICNSQACQVYNPAGINSSTQAILDDVYYEAKGLFLIDPITKEIASASYTDEINDNSLPSEEGSFKSGGIGPNNSYKTGWFPAGGVDPTAVNHPSSVSAQSQVKGMGQWNSVRWATGCEILGWYDIDNTQVFPIKSMQEILTYYYPYYILENCDTGTETYLWESYCQIQGVDCSLDFSNPVHTFTLTENDLQVVAINTSLTSGATAYSNVLGSCKNAIYKDNQGNLITEVLADPVDSHWKGASWGPEIIFTINPVQEDCEVEVFLRALKQNYGLSLYLLEDDNANSVIDTLHDYGDKLGVDNGNNLATSATFSLEANKPYYLVLDVTPSRVSGKYISEVMPNLRMSLELKNCQPPVVSTSGNTKDEAIQLQFGTSCPQPPNTFDLTGATASNPNESSCDGAIDEDMYFKFTTGASGYAYVRTRYAQGSTLTDTGLKVYKEVNDILVEVACDQNSYDDGDEIDPDYPYFNSILLNLDPNTEYFIRIWEFGGDVQDEFEICVYDPSTTMIDLQISCGNLSNGSTYTADATISGQAVNYLVTWYLFKGDNYDNNGNTVAVRSEYITDINTSTVTFSTTESELINMGLGKGEYKLAVVVDDGEDIRELNETNNFCDDFTTTIVVTQNGQTASQVDYQPKMDLEIPPPLVAGAPMRAKIWTKNFGAEAATKSTYMRLVWSYNDECSANSDDFISETTIAPLGKNKKTPKIWQNLTVPPDYDSQRSLYLCLYTDVMPGKTVGDGVGEINEGVNEGNNCLCMELEENNLTLPGIGGDIKIKPYPNPASDQVTIGIENMDGPGEITVHNFFSGLTILGPVALAPGAIEYQFSVSNWNNGMYVVCLVTQGIRKCKKIRVVN